MEAQGQQPAWMERLAELNRWRERLQSGEVDPLDVDLATLIRETVECFGEPPSDSEAQELWLSTAGEALRVASDLLNLKAQRLAPEPAREDEGTGGDEAAVADEPAGGDLVGLDDQEEAPSDALDVLARRAEAYRRFKEAARLLEEQAEAWSRHQPRQAPSALLETLERVLGPWPDDLPPARAERLVEALAKVLDRTRMADRARHAPSPGFDWEELLGRVRRRVDQAGGPVDLAELLVQEARHRTEVIGLFLAVLELLRVGELCLTEQDGNLWIQRRS